MSTYWKNWIKAAAIRAVKTVAQITVDDSGTISATEVTA